MKKKKAAVLCLSVWAVCLVLSFFDKAEMKIPEDTSAIERFVETAAHID